MGNSTSVQMSPADIERETLAILDQLILEGKYFPSVIDFSNIKSPNVALFRNDTETNKAVRLYSLKNILKGMVCIRIARQNVKVEDAFDYLLKHGLVTEDPTCVKKSIFTDNNKTYEYYAERIEEQLIKNRIVKPIDL